MLKASWSTFIKSWSLLLEIIIITSFCVIIDWPWQKCAFRESLFSQWHYRHLVTFFPPSLKLGRDHVFNLSITLVYIGAFLPEWHQPVHLKKTFDELYPFNHSQLWSWFIKYIYSCPAFDQYHGVTSVFGQLPSTRPIYRRNLKLTIMKSESGADVNGRILLAIGM